MDHERRMEIAKRVTEFVRLRHPEVIAVAVHGSTAHGEDRAWSDLEMFAITRGSTGVRGYGTIHGGVVVEIALTSEEDAFREVRSVPGKWPASVDGWIHTIATHDPEGIIPRLAAHAATPDPASVDCHLRGALISMYEDLCKIRNLVAAGEDDMARFMSPNFAQWGVANYLAFLNRQPYNGTRNLLTKPREFAVLPPHFWDDYPALLGVHGTARELLERAERMFRECRSFLLERGLAPPEDSSLEDGLERGRSPPD